jgi:hypothetical protein
MLGNSFLVECRRLPFHDPDGVGRAFRQAVSKAVAVAVRYQLRFPVDDPERSFMAGTCTKAAAVAFIFVNGDYFSYHVPSPF